jgi:hypothetical protein
VVTSPVGTLDDPMPVAFVLVHSPVVGPSTWTPTADALRRRGHHVLVPATTPPVDCEPPWWEAAARDVVAAVDTDAPLVVAGHSGAGPRIPAIGDALEAAGHRIAAHVLVDAGMPYPNRTPAEAAPAEFAAQLEALVRPDGLLPPWPEWWPAALLEELVPDPDLRAAVVAECRPTPSNLYDEPVPVRAGWPGGTPCGYLSYTYEADAAEAERRGWMVARAKGSHLQPVVDPEGVADQLLLLVSGLGAAS